LDWIGFLYGFGALQGVVLASILVLIKSGHRQANVIMAILVIVIALRVVQKLLVHVHYWETSPTLALTLYPVIYAWGPLLYLYARTLIGGKFHPRDGWHFLPVVAFFFLLNLSYWGLTSDQQVVLVRYIWSPRTDVQMAAELKQLLPFTWMPLMESFVHSLFFSMQLATYCILVIRLIGEHNQRIQKEFSSIDQMNLRWLRSLVVAVLVFLVLFCSFYLVPAIAYDHVDMGSVQVNVQNLFLVIVIYGIGIAALFQPALLSGGSLDGSALRPGLVSIEADEERHVEVNSATEAESSRQEDDENKYQRSGMSKEDAQAFRIQLMDLMQREQLYLRNDLALADLAEAAALSTHQVSQVINSQLNQNFFSFVNDYRIQHAKELLLDPDTRDMAIVELAFEVGFSSKSAFYEAFKRVTAMTPTQFKRSTSD
tara:strand:+ start:393 stop:1673 length:1281 start_codon:yes stop_codon:yes gene_type:complete